MANISFIEQRFSDDISYGSKGGPKFKTEVFMASSGAEQRNQSWELSRAEYDVSHGIRDKEDMDEVRKLFYAVRGRAIGFRFKDWSDFEMITETIATGDGTKTEFQIVKAYTMAGADDYVRMIKKIVASTVAAVTVGGSAVTEGTDFAVDYDTGIITFTTAPANGAAIIVGLCEFDVPVRFDIDYLPVNLEAWQLETASGIKLVELR